jgi:hypothetical protein
MSSPEHFNPQIYPRLESGVWTLRDWGKLSRRPEFLPGLTTHSLSESMQNGLFDM